MNRHEGQGKAVRARETAARAPRPSAPRFGVGPAWRYAAAAAAAPRRRRRARVDVSPRGLDPVGECVEFLVEPPAKLRVGYGASVFEFRDQTIERRLFADRKLFPLAR